MKHFWTAATLLAAVVVWTIDDVLMLKVGCSFLLIDVAIAEFKLARRASAFPFQEQQGASE